MNSKYIYIAILCLLNIFFVYPQNNHIGDKLDYISSLIDSKQFMIADVELNKIEKSVLMSEQDSIYGHFWDLRSQVYVANGRLFKAIEGSNIVLEFLNKSDSSKINYIKGLHRFAGCYLETSQFNKAEELYLKAIDLYIKHNIKDAIIQDICTEIGLLYEETKHLEEAAYYYKLGQKLSEKVFSKFDNYKSYECLFRLTELYHSTNQIDSALYSIDSILELNRLTCSPTDEVYLYNMTYKAILYFDSGNYEKALDIFLDIFSKFDNQPSNVPDNMNLIIKDITCCYAHLRNWQKVQEFQLISESFYDTKNEDIGFVYNTIAHVYRADRNFEQAVRYFKKELETEQELHNTIFSKYFIGDCYISMNKYDKAIIYLEDISDLALSGKTGQFNYMKDVYYLLYTAHSKCKQYEKAHDALELMASYINPRNIKEYTFYTLDKSSILRRLNRIPESIKLLESLILKNKVSDFDNIIDYLTVLNELSISYIKQTDNEKAQRTLNEALLLSKENLGDNHPFTGSIYHNLGKVYMNINEYKTALVYLLKSKNIQENSNKSVDPLTLEYINICKSRVQ